MKHLLRKKKSIRIWGDLRNYFNENPNLSSQNKRSLESSFKSSSESLPNSTYSKNEIKSHLQSI